MGMDSKKHCNGCQQDKPVAEFSPRIRNGKTIFRARCKTCESAATAKYRKTHPEWWKERKAAYYARNPQARLFEKWRRFARQNGLPPDEVVEYIKSHNGLCDICGEKSNDETHSELHLDHCHATNGIRGRLCNRCNIGLGQFRDNPSLLLKAVEYLSRNPIIDIGIGPECRSVMGIK